MTVNQVPSGCVGSNPTATTGKNAKVNMKETCVQCKIEFTQLPNRYLKYCFSCDYDGQISWSIENDNRWQHIMYRKHETARLLKEILHEKEFQKEPHWIAKLVKKIKSYSNIFGDIV